MAKILEIENLTVSFDGFKALKNLNFSMDAGELRVVIGPNGAGKTTFLDVITGKVQPTEGRAIFKGKNLRSIPEHKIARMGVGRKFQTPRVYLNLTPRENLELSCNRSKGVFNTLFGKVPKGDRQTVASLLETIGLTAKADIQAALLSHGEKQRLEIGMLVAQSPDLLLVDEPVAGLTDEETYRVGELLLALAESHSILVIEHDMEFVRQIARKVTVLHEGTVLCEGSMDEVQNDSRVIEVYLGQAPSITEEQMAVLRIAATMAWTDTSFAPVEQEIILSRLSRQFGETVEQQQSLRHELVDYLARAQSLEYLVQQLPTAKEREQVLELAYEIISANLIDQRESELYSTLVSLLELPPEVVSQVEARVEAANSAVSVGLDEQQLALMQIAASMAWADGRVDPAEVDTILKRLCDTFAKDEVHALNLQQALPNLILRHIPLEMLVPKLTTTEAKEMAVRVSYAVMQSDAIVSVQELKVYQDLLGLLQLPAERVSALEASTAELQPV